MRKRVEKWSPPGCASAAGRVSQRGARRSQAEMRTSGATVHVFVTKNQKIKGRVLLRGDIVKDTLDLMQYLPNISFNNDSSKSHGYHFQILPGCAGRAADAAFVHTKVSWKILTVENSKIRVSTRLDSLTTTQMAFIMVKYGKPNFSFWKEFVWSYLGRTLRETVWKLEMFLCTSSKRITLVYSCG